MLFQMPSFLAFFVVFCALFAVCPGALRLPLVTVASLFFYGWWYPPYVILLVALMLFCWLALLAVHRDRRWLAPAVVVALLPLLLFKYTDFLLRTLGELTGASLPHLGWMLPLGISFVTFTILCYLIDTARHPAKRPPEFWPTAVFLTFFPHLLAGPILRAQHILPQLPQMRLAWAALTPNLALFAVGMMKKVLIAGPVGSFVDQSYQMHGTLGGWHALATIFGFAVQIYCDFSAYSDMAIALAGMLGIAFPENFHSPYAAGSTSELWRRWHMTLSFWLRDYVLKPLHQRFYRHARQLALLLTMVLSGLWHGAAWTFVVWGTLNGLVMAIESATGYSRYATHAKGLRRAGCVALTFGLWCTLAVIFRAPDLATAWSILGESWGRGGWEQWPAVATVPVALGVLLLVLHPVDQIDRIRAAAQRVPAALLVPVLLAIIAGCSLLASMRPQNFYYFDF